MMWGMLALTIAVVALALVLLWRQEALVSIHFVIAAALGIGLTMLLASALMGLLFLSSGTGHDHSVDDRVEGGGDQSGTVPRRGTGKGAGKAGWRQ